MRFGLSPQCRLLHGACQERRDLRAGAGGVRIEASAAHAGGNAVLHGPSHGLRIVAVGGNVSKRGRTAQRRLAHGPPQHRHHLGAVDGAIGVRAVGNALGLGPVLSAFVPSVAAPPLRSASFWRARIVHSCARVVELLGA